MGRSIASSRRFAPSPPQRISSGFARIARAAALLGEAVALLDGIGDVRTQVAQELKAAVNDFGVGIARKHAATAALALEVPADLDALSVGNEIARRAEEWRASNAR